MVSHKVVWLTKQNVKHMREWTVSGKYFSQKKLIQVVVNICKKTIIEGCKYFAKKNCTLTHVTSGSKYSALKNGCKYFHIIHNEKVLSNKFPYLLKKLRKIKNLKNVTFSCLESNQSSTIHNQFDSDLFRVHIPIDIPKNNCGICVENQCRTWKYGSFLLVDENLMHKVWNNSNSHRIVLLLDVSKVKI